MSPKKKERVALGEATGGPALNTAFAQLAGALSHVVTKDADLGVTPAANPIKPPVQPEASLEQVLATLAKPHAFKSRKGRGGKTVTEVDHLDTLDASMLAQLCKRLCQRFGCGGSVEGHAIVLQGDQVDCVNTFFKDARQSARRR